MFLLKSHAFISSVPSVNVPVMSFIFTDATLVGSGNPSPNSDDFTKVTGIAVILLQSPSPDESIVEIVKCLRQYCAPEGLSICAKRLSACRWPQPVCNKYVGALGNEQEASIMP